MGATTFSLSKKNRARQARRNGKIKEAEALEKAAKKFVPKTIDRTDAEVEVDLDGNGKPDVKASKTKKEVDLDGNGNPDVVIPKK